MTGASFSSNHAQEGAGMYNEYEATVGGSGFQYNIASEGGPGLYEDGTFAHLSDSKVFSNHAPSGGGGGIYNDDTVTLANTPVTINTVNNCLLLPPRCPAAPAERPAGLSTGHPRIAYRGCPAAVPARCRWLGLSWAAQQPGVNKGRP